jgi:hypothetical protein
MPNQNHYELLKSGVDDWNKWRKRSQSTMPDLVNAILDGVNLKGINL